jgi:hypothetical protein
MNHQNQDAQAILGHLLDLYKLCKLSFVNPHSYTKFRIISGIQKRFRANAFIETGTYLGVTTRRCAPLFEQVYTVELDVALASKASEFLKSRDNIKVIQGDALEILPRIYQEETGDVIVFLDGHFSGGDTACGNIPEPALEELKILGKYKDRTVAVIIDDFRLFGTEPGFPTKSSLFEVIEEQFPGFNITVFLDQIVITRQNQNR